MFNLQNILNPGNLCLKCFAVCFLLEKSETVVQTCIQAATGIKIVVYVSPGCVVLRSMVLCFDETNCKLICLL